MYYPKPYTDIDSIDSYIGTYMNQNSNCFIGTVFFLLLIEIFY